MITGQRVVCIHAGNWFERTTREIPQLFPQKGHIYTVQRYRESSSYVLISLAELPEESFFDAKGFIPLDENWTEEVITNVLKKQLTKPELQTI